MNYWHHRALQTAYEEKSNYSWQWRLLNYHMKCIGLHFALKNAANRHRCFQHRKHWLGLMLKPFFHIVHTSRYRDRELQLDLMLWKGEPSPFPIKTKEVLGQVLHTKKVWFWKASLCHLAAGRGKTFESSNGSFWTSGRLYGNRKTYVPPHFSLRCSPPFSASWPF